MKFIQLLALTFIINANSAIADDHSGYRLGVGDLVNVSVLMEPDMSIETRVDSVGSIKMPYLGPMEAAGSTAEELGERITEILGRDYLVNPRVNVEIKEYRPFYIQGAVQNPGSFPFTPGLTVERAASIAGGFTRRANTKSFVIARETTVGEFSVSQRELRDSVHPGDTITVKETYF